MAGYNKRIASGRVVVNGVVAKRTRKSGSPTTKHSVRQRTTMEMREIAYKMSMQYVAQKDIATALGVSQPYVWKLINDETEARQAQYQITAEKWRQHAIERNEFLLSHWVERATKTPRAADVVLGYETRGDKLKGLYVNRQEISGPGGGAMRMNATALDMSRYTEEELQMLEHLVEKGTVVAKPIESDPVDPEGGVT